MQTTITVRALAATALVVIWSAGSASAGLFWSQSAPTKKSSSALHYHDGTYRGPSVRQYYGYVQAQAHIKNGKIVAIDILRSPTDRRTSQYINSIALPRLKSEIVQAQNTHVSNVSGATLSSDAFLASTHAALLQSLN
ncbi:FMN-binding protein [Thioclava sp.]|uniref:FMN-binding protein n=1 Tax=Thioclava sp. TaxID=1933450 RepID=UPI003AA872F0